MVVSIINSKDQPSLTLVELLKIKGLKINFLLEAFGSVVQGCRFVGPAPDAWYKRKARQFLKMLMGGKSEEQERPLLEGASPDETKEPSEIF
eukprot:symbB.v1.2.002664.t1/scaffold138.1/size301272/5